MSEKTQTLTEALDKIPPSYEVWIKRESDSGGWWMKIDRKQNGGRFSIMSGTHPLWQQAFAEIWSKL